MCGSTATRHKDFEGGKEKREKKKGNIGWRKRRGKDVNTSNVQSINMVSNMNVIPVTRFQAYRALKLSRLVSFGELQFVGKDDRSPNRRVTGP